MKKILILVAFLYISVFYAQEVSVEIKGFIQIDSKGVGNIHILNLATKSVTISDNHGFFQILVKTGDTILISSIQYEIAMFAKTQTLMKIF